jgi:Methyltransferase domain
LAGSRNLHEEWAFVTLTDARSFTSSVKCGQLLLSSLRFRVPLAVTRKIKHEFDNPAAHLFQKVWCTGKISQPHLESLGGRFFSGSGSCERRRFGHGLRVRPIHQQYCIAAAKKFAMDLNPQAQQHLAKGVTLFQQDCSTAWPLPDKSLDVVFSSNFFEHLPSNKPGGQYSPSG